jgi:hypothetical protein
MKLTVKSIIEDIEKAIRQFGLYSYEDKGAFEVMDVDSYVDRFKEIGADATIELLQNLYDSEYEHKDGFISAIVGLLDDWDGEEGEKFLNSEIFEICQDL